MLAVVNAATKRAGDEDNDGNEDEYEEFPRFDEGEDDSKPADVDPEYTTPRNDAWLADIDFSVIKGNVRPVGSGICENAKCDGTDNDQCFETCGNMATAEDIYGCPQERTWSLTFDDGPSEFTHELLDILDSLDIKATFCVMGAHVKKFPEIVKRAYESGHQIASHTYSHPHLMSLTNEEIVYEIRATEEAIQNAIGIKPAYIRPPYGEADQRVKTLLKQMGYKILMWNVDPTDYNVHMLANGPDLIQHSFQKVIEEKNSNLNVHSDYGFISLQHDLYQVSIQQVPNIVRALRSGNYTMLTSAACLGDVEPHVRTSGRLEAVVPPVHSHAKEVAKPSKVADSSSMIKAFPGPSLVQNFPSPSVIEQQTTMKAAETPSDLSKIKNKIGKTVFKSDASRLVGSLALWMITLWSTLA
ncbi:hypothetical protein G6F56_002960 [Rhizopus delemar]|uniref:Chitin deacetylase n=1 Tax=Rhizopus stolonifer TaxID=4846 RepID=A0A367IVN8_RHIST|nr:hypothetical protein G6F56_002960 [Rhizopus delemar]RCH81737.1 chitin deacetylase [Rhizopus stolonifer]